MFARHGYSGKRNPTYYAWHNMKQRCLNPLNPIYDYYGGRGITVCEKWINSFEEFLKDVGPKPDAKLTLERIDNSRGYEPGNVKWATRLEQAHNKRPRRHRYADGFFYD